MKTNLIQKIESSPANSAWSKGVRAIAASMVEDLELADGQPVTMEALMNGARDWKEYSYGGCALIYDCDIAERFCTPSELKRKRGGELQPNIHETWLDVQARACHQAARLIMRKARVLASAE